MSKKKELLKESQEIIKKYNLESHVEGGYFSEVYTASTFLPSSQRAIAGSIYFLLDQNDISLFHRIDCEEIWFYHLGVGMNIYFVENDNKISVRQLGIGEGQFPMVVVPKGTIFCAENVDCKGFTFISCITAPKFFYKGFELITKKMCPNLPSEYEKFYSPENVEIPKDEKK